MTTERGMYKQAYIQQYTVRMTKSHCLFPEYMKVYLACMEGGYLVDLVRFLEEEIITTERQNIMSEEYYS